MGLFDGLFDSASSAADVASDFLGDAWDTGAKAFSWLEENPTTASILGGGALGLLKYRQAERDRKERKRERAEDRAYRDQFGGASSGSPDRPTLTGGTGLLTEGILAGSKKDNGTI